jgi:hypothetical protein
MGLALPRWQCFGAVERWPYGMYVRYLHIDLARMRPTASREPPVPGPVRDKEQP